VILDNVDDLLPNPNPILSFGEFDVSSAVTTTTISGSSMWGDSQNNSSCTYSGSGTITWGGDPLRSHHFEIIPFATGGELYRKGWFETSGTVEQQVEYTANCTSTSTRTEIDEITGEPRTVTETSSSTDTFNLTPEVWPADVSDIKAELSNDGSTVIGSITAPNGNKYRWNLKSLREP
jgi:hypothetical protein